jgi:hypothetical protein
MKAYQVFTGDFDKHGRQYYELIATYFSKERALEKCREIVEADAYKTETIEESGWYHSGRVKEWDVLGWDNITICKFTEIDITE